MRKPTAVLLASLSFAAAAADVYRWVDANGVVHYSDKPQAPNAQPAQLPNLQTYKSGSTPPGFAPSAPPAAPAAAPAQTIAIASPAQDETIRDAEGQVSVNVSGEVQNGQGLVYYLDGTPQNTAPTPSTAYLLTGVERGEHRIAVALVGPDGQEVARSAAVTIYMKPPTAKH